MLRSSSIHRDSSLGKILSTKRVESSVSSNVDTNVATSGASAVLEEAIATAEENSELQPEKSLAEVRLVVRFLVEEHIVFNGKVEQVKHLDKTELSRIVSRIAWDGARDEKRPTSENEGIFDNVEIAKSLEDNTKLNIRDPTIKTDPPHDDSLSQDDKTFEMIRSIEDGFTDAAEPKYLTADDTSSSPVEVSLTDLQKGTTSIEEHLSEGAKDKNNSDCDNQTATFISDDICETKHRQTKSSYVIGRHQLQDEKRVSSENSEDDKPSLKNDIEHDFSSIDSQMVVDAINDCVLNVDLESRQNAQLNGLSDISCINESEIEEIEHDITERLEKVETIDIDEIKSVQHNEISHNVTTEQVVEIDKKPLAEAANILPNNEITRETIPNDSDVDYIREKDAQTNDACKNDLNQRRAPNQKTDNISSCSSRKRSTSDNGGASKRIRRLGSKDQQRNYRGASRTTENLIERRDKTIPNSPMVDEEGGYFARHSKILAKWSDNHFYPGTISKQKGDRKFEVIFYDGARKDVPETDLIPVCNILGKQVRISIAEGYCVNAIVLSQLSNNNQPMFDVEYQQNGLVNKRVPLVDIFLTAEQGIPLINQPIKPDKNPDESMFAGVDLDNIVHVKRSRRLQEMEEFEPGEELLGNTSTTLNGKSGRRKRGQYNMREVTTKVRTSLVVTGERIAKRSHPDVNNQDTPASSCSPDTLKTNLDSSTSNSPSESSSSREANKF